MRVLRCMRASFVLGIGRMRIATVTASCSPLGGGGAANDCPFFMAPGPGERSPPPLRYGDVERMLGCARIEGLLFIGERFGFVVESFEGGRSRFRSTRTRRPVAVFLRGRGGLGDTVRAAVARWRTEPGGRSETGVCLPSTGTRTEPMATTSGTQVVSDTAQSSIGGRQELGLVQVWVT